MWPGLMPSDRAFPAVAKRAHERRKVMLRALLQAEVSDAERLGGITDLSMSGAFIEMRSRPLRGSRLWVSLTLGDGTPLHSYVEVVRVTDRGVGARFVRLDPGDAELLRAVIAPS
jgi:hypothetical protein